MKYHKIVDGYFNVFADRPCAPGAQLAEDYGDNPGSIYFNHHGFVPANNPFDCVDVELPEIPRGPRWDLASEVRASVVMSEGDDRG